MNEDGGEGPTEPQYDMYIGANSRYKEEDGTVFFKTYIPPSRDDIPLPQYWFYLLISASMVCGVLYAIIGHLMRDLVHDILDWMFGAEPEEVRVNLCEAKDKFQEDWCPETSAELTEMVRQEEIKVGLEEDKNPGMSPAIWTISGNELQREGRSSGLHVAFGRVNA